MKKTIVIFSGYNQRAVIALCRYLAMYNSRAFIIAKNSEDPIYDTIYKHWVCHKRNQPNLEVDTCKLYFSEIQKLSGNKEILIMPTTEFLNRFFLINLEQFIDVKIPLVDLNLYNKISDKNSFKALCSKFGLLVPRSLSFMEIVFPCVAKRKSYSMSVDKRVKPYLIFNQQNLTDFVAQENVEDFYFEEYVDGNSYYLLYSIDKEGNCETYAQKNLIQQHDGKSILAATKADINIDVISQQYTRLFKMLKFYGLVMVEIRELNGQFYMIEANPRFWGPMQFVVDNAPQLLDLFFINNDIKFTGENNKLIESDYFWFGGYIENRIKNQPVKFYFNSSTDWLDDLTLAKWLKSDVYLQNDTLEYFYKELNKL